MSLVCLSTAHTFSGTKDVWFSLNGTTYQNNSIVALEDIGEGDDALLCVTNQITCCGLGFMWLYTNTWFFPNGTGVPSIGDFYRSRGQMSVHLNRRRGGVEGIFRCEILDSMNVIQTIYIGVYIASTGEFYMYNTLFSYTHRYYTAYLKVVLWDMCLASQN